MPPHLASTGKNAIALVAALQHTEDNTISLVAGSGGNMANTVAARTPKLTVFAAASLGASVA